MDEDVCNACQQCMKLGCPSLSHAEAEHKGRREVGSGGGGGRFGLAYFTDDQIAEYVNDAVKAALTNLEARPAPATVAKPL